MRLKFGGLWQHRDFLNLWGAHTTSVFGTQLASLAYPLTAVIVLQASSFQMGMLRASASAAAVLVGLFAGVIVDRVSRKSLLIASDLGRTLLALTIPAAFLFGILRIEQLYIVGFLTGALNILSEVAFMAILPSLVEKEQLVEGNSKFVATESIAGITGTTASGVLVQTLTAPVTIIIDVVSFAFSALFVWLIRTPEAAPAAKENRQSIRKEIGEGLRFVYKNPILRPMSESIALHFLFILIYSTVFTLYAVRELQIEPILLGVIFSALGFGALAGALTVKRITKRFGIGHTMIFGTLLNAFAIVLVALASGSLLTLALILISAHFMLAFGAQIHGINLMSLRQSITPNQLQGRMNASFRFINVCAMMFGALIAGALGEFIGLRSTLAVAAAGMFLPFLRLIVSPVRNFKESNENNQ